MRAILGVRMFTKLRALPAVLIVALAGSAVVALQAPASAAITASNITSPASGSWYTVTVQGAPSTITVTGTSNGTTGDHVDIRCYWSATRWSSGPSNVAVAADGSFTTSVSPGIGYGHCRLRAVPSALAAGSPVDAYTGPVITTEYNYPERNSGGVHNDGKIYDYYVEFQSAHALNDYASALGGGGLYDSVLTSSTWEISNFLWYGNGYLDRSDDTRAGLQIDGHNAYGPYGAHYYFPDNVGVPALSYSASRAANGVTTIHESDPVVICPSDTFPPTAGSCPHFTSAGVTLDRTIVASDGGLQVQITDSWRSTNHKAHKISAHYEQWVDGTDHSTGTSVALPVGVKLPWLGGYQTFSSDTSYAGTGKVPNTVFYRDSNTAPNPSTVLPRGSVTFDFPVSQVHRKTNRELTLNAGTLSIPAGGHRVVRQAYVLGTSEGEVAAKAATNVVRLNPYRADGVIRRKGGANFGNGIYNTSATGQTVRARTKRSRTATFFLTVQNDGTLNTTFKVQGPGNRRGFSVRYLAGSQDITSAITHGTYRLRNVGPGQSRVIRLLVTVKPGTPVGLLRSWLVMVTSRNDSSSRDAVKAQVRVRH